MAQMGVSVPPGFIIPIELQKADSQDIRQAVREGVGELERLTGQRFGDSETPLLLSVRSGAPVSMPGMMDTFLNIGMHPHTLSALQEKLSPPLVEGMVQEFVKNYALRIKGASLSGKESHHLKQDFFARTGSPWQEDIEVHLWHAIQAVWKSWDSPRAHYYREQNEIAHTGGSAVIVQAMVFGNGASPSGTGVFFTRNPMSGQEGLFGEYLVSAQGESLVSGSVTPLALEHMRTLWPHLYQELQDIGARLDSYYGDMQDIEFTFEQGKLWILQTRSGKRTAQAAFKIAHDQALSLQSSKLCALSSIPPQSIGQLLYPQLVSHEGLELIGQGLPASPGTATGVLTFDPKKATRGHILIREETASEDMPGMMAAKGVVTLKGGMTSHAAVVMRGIGKPCVTSIQGGTWNNGVIMINGQALQEGQEVTIDGTTGYFFRGRGKVQHTGLSLEAKEVLSWADEIRRLEVLANADTVTDIRTALELGAEGVGLCRSEHMMFSPTHLHAFQGMILASSVQEREKHLSHLLPLHQKDFYDLFNVLEGRLFTVRLLDPPLHEFLPLTPDDYQASAAQLGVSLDTLEHRLNTLKEVNPMLGHRGCRLGITFPEIYRMQVRALFHAAQMCHRENTPTQLAILIPFIVDVRELNAIISIIDSEKCADVSYTVGAMIETPRAALVTASLVANLDFISFGTNDLTQMTWGLSRDDSPSFFGSYLPLGIKDPFAHFDPQGVGELVSWSCQQARKIKPSLKISVCGEHAGTPSGISFFNDIGVDAISCSPWRIPTARLCAAQRRS
jgi:pyruvate,orthophosphate dikinase